MTTCAGSFVSPKLAYFLLCTALVASCFAEPPQYREPAGGSGGPGTRGEDGGGRPLGASGSEDASGPSGAAVDAAGGGVGAQDGGGGSGTAADGPAAVEPDPVVCGNGRVDPGETCDPPSDCLRACSEVTCTVQRLVGSPDTCNVRCEEEKITTCASGDKCCPRAINPTCTAVNDAECSAVCDNGVIEAGETCDPKSTCQTKADGCKDDRDTQRTITGDVNTCTTACTERKRPCQAGDSQCPTGCTAGTDPDCNGCGNGKVEAGETCDPPAECMRAASACRDDGDTLRTGSGDTSRCTFTCMERRRPCQSGDGQCPSGCSATADNDCPGCGNRRVESGETCDPCGNTSCNSDGNTIRTPTGSAASCTFRCQESPRPCGQPDGQCPNGCAAGQDPDCRRARGQPCNDDNECIDGNCANGVCCNSACNDGCRACNLSGRVGTCSAPSNTEACGNNANGGNGRDDNCNGQVDEGCCGGSGRPCCAGGDCNGNLGCNRSNSRCQNKLTNGERCSPTNADLCQSGNCVDEICCRTEGCPSGTQCSRGGACLKVRGQSCQRPEECVGNRCQSRADVVGFCQNRVDLECNDVLGGCLVDGMDFGPCIDVPRECL